MFAAETDPNLTTLLLAAIAALASVIGVMAKWVISLHKDLRELVKEHGLELERKATTYAAGIKEQAAIADASRREFIDALKAYAEIAARERVERGRNDG